MLSLSCFIDSAMVLLSIPFHWGGAVAVMVAGAGEDVMAVLIEGCSEALNAFAAWERMVERGGEGAESRDRAGVYCIGCLWPRVAGMQEA